MIDDAQSNKSEWSMPWILSLSPTKNLQTNSIINAAQMLLKRGNALVGGKNVNSELTNSF